MNNLLQIILSSTLIVAVINNFINVYNHNKDSKLQFITSERNNCRNEIKKIACELQKSTPDTGGTSEDIKIILTKLKTRLNAYGIKRYSLNTANDPFDVFKDEHIWKIIYDMEISNDRNKVTTLINYLSCLLKFDWERSKKEVLSQKMNYISMFFIVVTLMSYLCIINKNQNFNLLTFRLILSQLSFFMFILVAYFILMIPMWIDQLEIFRTYKWYRKKYNYSLVLSLISLFIIVTIIILRYAHNSSFGTVFSISYLLALCSSLLSHEETVKLYKDYDEALSFVISTNTSKSDINKVR